MSLSKKSFSFPVIYILLALVLLGLDRFGLLSSPRSFFEKFTLPVKQFIWQEYQAFNQSLSKKQNQASSLILIREHMEALERENLSLRGELGRLKEENQSMRRLLGAPLSSSWQFVPAKVIGLQGDIVRINQGAEQGIVAGAAVVVEKVLVGEVIEAGSRTSQVRLISHVDFTAPAQIQEGGFKGIIKIYGSRLFLEEIPLEADLKPGNLVIREQDDLVVGTIGRIVSDPKDPWQKAEVIWPIEANRLKNVFVVIFPD